MDFGQNTSKVPADASPCAWRTDHILLLTFVAILGLAWWDQIFPIPELRDAIWIDGLLLLVATVSTLASYSRTLPFQNVLWAAIVIGAIGGAANAIAVLSGIPFGSFVYTGTAGPRILGAVPIAIPLVWIVIIFASRGTARLVLRPWRQDGLYGIWMLALTALLSLELDVGLEMYAGGVKRYWIWQTPNLSAAGGGAPLISFAGWLLTSLLILVVVTPMLLNKKPGSEPGEFGTFGIWILLNLLFATAALKNGFRAGFGIEVMTAAIACVLIVCGRQLAVRRNR